MKVNGLKFQKVAGHFSISRVKNIYKAIYVIYWMKALFLNGVENISIEDVGLNDLDKDEVRVKVEACGVCGSDIHSYFGKNPLISYPVVPGHEFSGIIVESRSKSFKTGDRVAVDPNIACNKCRYCISGRKNFCRDFVSIGNNIHGGFSEYVNVPDSQLYRIPDNVSFIEASVTEPVACIIHGLDIIHARVGESALILGAGFIGLTFLQILKNMGYNPLMVSELNEYRLNTARSLGADIVSGNLYDYVMEKTDNNGVDLIVETTGNMKLFEGSLDIISNTGRILAFAVYDPDAYAKIKPSVIFRKEITITGEFTNPYTMERALNLIASKAINFGIMLNKIIDINNVENAFRGNISDAIKAVMVNK